MNCPSCSTVVRDGAKFCDHCGSDLSVISSESALEDLQTLLESPNAPSPPIDDETIIEMPGAEPALSNRYEIREELGRGGFAVVSRGRDRNLDRDVAIKRLLTKALASRNAEALLQRFKTEAIAIARLKHRNIVQVYDYQQDAEGYYIVMEYIEGATLDEYIKERGSLSPDEAVELVKGIAHGLFYSHKNKLIHRDIKPSNVILASEDGKLVPKIVDFGLARAGGESDLSQTGFAMGTPGYMAPEQRRDAKNVDHRADIYSLGKVLYVLLTGEKPHDVIPDLIPPPPLLTEIIFKCINPKIEERYFSIEALVDRLESVAGASRIKTNTLQMIVQNVCQGCNSPNQENEKFCAVCGSALTVNCPECQQENSVHRAFCTECGTDIKVYSAVADCYRRAKEFYAEKQWRRVVKEVELLPDDIELRQAQGREMQAELRKLHQDAQQNLTKAGELKESLQQAIETRSYSAALQMIDAYQKIVPDDSTINELPAQLNYRRISASFDESVECARMLLDEQKLVSSRQHLDAVFQLRDEYTPPANVKWHNEWDERCKELAELNAELQECELHVERLLKAANTALSAQDYDEACRQCEAILELSSECTERDMLEQQARSLQGELDGKLRLAKKQFAGRSWASAEAACIDVLQLQQDNTDAATMLERSRAHLRRVKTVRLASVVIVLSLISIALAVAIKRTQTKKKERDAQIAEQAAKRAAAAFEKAMVESAAAYTAAEGAIKDAESLEYLAVAKRALDTLTTPQNESQLNDEQQRRVALQRDTINQLSSAREQVIELEADYASIINANDSDDVERLVDLWTRLAATEGALDSEHVVELVPTARRRRVTTMRERAEQRLRHLIVLPMDRARSNALKNDRLQTTDFQRADGLKAKAREAVNRGQYSDAITLVRQVVQLFGHRSTLHGGDLAQTVADELARIVNDYGEKPTLLEPIRRVVAGAEKAAESGKHADAAAAYRDALTRLQTVEKEIIARNAAAHAVDIAIATARQQLDAQYTPQHRELLARWYPDVVEELALRIERADALANDGQVTDAAAAYGQVAVDAATHVFRAQQLAGDVANFRRILTVAEAQFDTVSGGDLGEQQRAGARISESFSGINIERLGPYLTNDERARYSRLREQLDALAHRREAPYAAMLNDARKFEEAARRDVIREASPRGNVLLALNYLEQATAHGLPASEATAMKGTLYAILLGALMSDVGPEDRLKRHEELREWALLTVRESGMPIGEFEQQNPALNGLSQRLLPPGFVADQSAKPAAIKTKDQEWYKLFSPAGTSAAGIHFRLIPPGQFVMGNDGARFAFEKPAHPVEITHPFYLATFEVLVGEFREFSQRQLNVQLFTDKYVPVSGVSYTQALRFCNWLSRRAGLQAAYVCDGPENTASATDWRFQPRSDGYRLPTEAEWEYVCRYAPGEALSDNLVDTVWNIEQGTTTDLLTCSPQALTAKAITPNHLGIYLMRGNLAELVNDWFGPYQKQAQVDPMVSYDPAQPPRHIARGGDFRGGPEQTSATYRQRLQTNGMMLERVGFRLVLPLPMTIPKQ